MESTQCSYRATGLQPGAIYRFQIVAFNEGGDSPESPVLRYRLAEGRQSPVKASAASTGTPAVESASDGDTAKIETDEDKSGGDQDAADPGSQSISKREQQAQAVVHELDTREVISGPGLELSAISPATFDARVQPVPAAPPSIQITPDSPEVSGTFQDGATGSGARHKKLPRRKSGYLTPSETNNRASWMLLSREFTIRGKRNGVRKTKANLFKKAEENVKELTPLQRTIEKERENGQVVLYTTSTHAIRETYGRCQRLMQILYNLRIKVFFKDISMDKAYAAEFAERVPGGMVPHLFAGGEPIGGYDDIFGMNERLELRDRLGKLGVNEAPMQDCSTCGGSGFIMCTWCGGTTRSTAVSATFTGGATNAGFLRCTVCNENGLERCREC